jgi:EAL domain-containing protein (putative c-di-GMP-specific phosphodiesterase class I)
MDSDGEHCEGTGELSRIIRERAIRTEYQAIVELTSQRVVAYEALTRGPVGTVLESPMALFSAARREGLLIELDWLCRVQAMTTALEVGYDRSMALFVNAEPAALRSSCPPLLRDGLIMARERLQVVIEVTERAVVSNPRDLLAAVARVRADGWGVALDDVGAEPGSLALMPFLNPDVIKLDIGLVQNPSLPPHADVLAAVIAHAERTGALVIAEGIEEPGHMLWARALGATHGQGNLLGRPGPLELEAGGAMSSFSWRGFAKTPFEIIASRRPVHRATKDLLLPISLHLETQAMASGQQPVVLGAFQDARYLTGATRARWEKLAAHSAFAAAMGRGVPEVPMLGVRGANLTDDDPLGGEWDVIVVGPHFAAALVAKDLGGFAPDHLRTFDYVVSYDRALVLEAARSLMSRVAPLDERTAA